ncbi:hypothetical protein PSCICM_32430 [Pseudomonas cichorii]|nr:hypothetical protein PSCICM_32430 [Pseudomonas cichorii]
MTEAVKRATKASTGSLKRPPQDWLVLSVLMDSLVALLKVACPLRGTRASAMITGCCFFILGWLAADDARDETGPMREDL